MYLMFQLIFVLNLSLGNPQIKEDELDQKILFHTYNSEFIQAIDLLDHAISKYPRHPKYYFFKSAMFFQQTFTTENTIQSDSIIKLSIRSAEKAIKVGEDLKQTAEVKFYLGASYGYLGRFHLMDGSWLNAFQSGRRGKDLLEEVIKKHPTYYDAYLGLGIFNYYIDQFADNPIIRGLVWIVGMSGNSKIGLEYLHKARKFGTLSYGESTFFLSTIYTDMEHDYDTALQYLEDFVKTYPNNKLMYNSYLRTLRRAGDFQTVKHLIETDTLDRVMPISKAIYFNNIGEYQMSLEHIKPILEHPKKNHKWKLYAAKFYYASNHWLLGNKAEFFRYQKELLELDYYKDQIRMLQKLSPENPTIAKLYKLEALINKFDDFDSIETILNSPFNLVDKNVTDFYHFNTGQYYFKQGWFQKAEVSFLEVGKNSEFSYQAYQFLIKIYLKENFPTQNVARLVKNIENYENKRLIYQAQKLEKKYHL